MTDSEWASKTARDFQRALAEKSQKDEVFLEQQRIKRSHIDDLWAKLKGAFYSKSNSLNHEINRQILTIEDSDNPDRLTIRRNEPKTARLAITCDRDTHEIKLVFSRTNVENVELGIDKESGKPYLTTAHSGPKEPEEIAESSIEKFLNSDL